jgi:hypothetical protein
LTFGRTNKISINVDSEVIEEFIAKPDVIFEIYGRNVSQQSFKYFKNIEKQNKLLPVLNVY